MAKATFSATGEGLGYVAATLLVACFICCSGGECICLRGPQGPACICLPVLPLSALSRPLFPAHTRPANFPTPPRLSPKRTLCPNRRPGALWAPGWPSSPSPQGTARGSRTPRGLPDCPIRRGLFYELLAFICWEKRPVLEPDRPGLESQLWSQSIHWFQVT